MRGRILVVLIFLVCLPGIISCKRDRYSVNISSADADIQIKRLENDLFGPDPSSIKDSLPQLNEEYKGFLQYFSYVINTGEINDTAFGDYLVGFCTDRLNTEVYSAVVKTFPDVSFIEAGLEKAFRHYVWHFPDNPVPAVFTCITGFNRSIITADSVLGISLDRYLGSDCEYYPRLEIYEYLAARMNPWNVVPDCMYAWGTKLWSIEDMNYPALNLLSEMIHEGKLRYFEKCMIPDINDTLLFGFTSDQMKFCRNNEDQMWMYLIEHDLLFSTDKFIIRKLTGEAPFTSYFTNESPGKAAVWIGFRIIESYMERNRNISLGDMMKDTDVQNILDRARYNPR